MPRKLLPVGPAYLAHVRRSIHNHSFEEHDKHEAERRERAKSEEADGNEDDLGVGDEEETPELLALDPKEWKVGFLFFDVRTYILVCCTCGAISFVAVHFQLDATI